MIKRWLFAAFLWAMAGVASASLVVIEENFDDPELEGWAIENRSTPVGPGTWFLGNAGIFTSHQGAPDAYASANFLSADIDPLTGTGVIDNWFFMPVVNSANGLILTFFTRAAGALPDRLEIWGSSNGASTSVGDFERLLTINQLLGSEYPTDWTQYSVYYSGFANGGRLAFRYFVEDAAVNGDYIGIDSVILKVPEPSTWVLVTLALGSLLLARRRARA